METRTFTGTINNNNFTVDEETAWELITALSEANEYAISTGRDATGRSYKKLHDDILKVVTTPTERLIKYHMYYGHKVIDYTFEGYTDDGMNKVLLVLDDGHVRTEYLYDDEFSEFTESFD